MMNYKIIGACLKDDGLCFDLSCSTLSACKPCLHAVYSPSGPAVTLAFPACA